MAAHIFQRRPNFEYPKIIQGEGPYLFDTNGKKYIDAIGGAGVACLGHGLHGITDQIAQHMKQTGYLHGMQFTSSAVEEFADEFVSEAPAPLSKIQFMCSGSEASEAAMKLAYQYYVARDKNHKKNKFLYTIPSYHGSTGLALSVTGKVRDQESFQSLLTSHPSISMPQRERYPYSSKKAGPDLDSTIELENTIARVGPENIAAFIIEPYGGASSGAAVLPDHYLQKAREICTRNDILLIFDEVMCGYGRTGKWFACDHYGVAPDILIAGKSLAAGLFPLSAILCTEAVFSQVVREHGAFKHGHTFTNHHLAIQAAQVVFRHIRDHDLLGNINRQEEYLFHRLRVLREKYPFIGDIRGKGFLIGMELVQDPETGDPFSRSAQMAEKVVITAMSKGLNLYFSIEFLPGRLGDAIMLMPPYNMTRVQIDETVDLMDSTFKSVAREIHPSRGQS